jgi:ketosteroid isomerase-like protein
MSQENVEIVRQVFDAAIRRDTDAVLALYDEAVEWETGRSPLTRLVGGGGTFHGHEGLRAFFRERYEAWEKSVDECEELIDAGDRIISVLTSRGQGRASGVEVKLQGYAAVWTIRDQKIIRVEWFPSREEALEAVGLRE